MSSISFKSSFDFTKLFSSLFSLLAMLLGSEGKNPEASYFKKIADFFNRDIE